MTARRPRTHLVFVALSALLACGSPAKKLESANALRVAGDSRGALGAYKAILAELGEGPLPREEAEVRAKALRFAGDVSYLELGDFIGALSYYRRIVSLQPGGEAAREARGVIGDIYLDRFNDPAAAIAQYAAVAASVDAPEAPAFQLKVARAYLSMGRYELARREAGLLREKWPTNVAADEAQLLTAQAWALEKREEEALGAFQALIDSKPRPDLAARALEGLAQVHAQAGRFDRALELYAEALPAHPNAEAVRTTIEAVRERREKARTVVPGDRAAAFDQDKVTRNRREEP